MTCVFFSMYCDNSFMASVAYKQDFVMGSGGLVFEINVKTKKDISEKPKFLPDLRKEQKQTTSRR